MSIDYVAADEKPMRADQQPIKGGPPRAEVLLSAPQNRNMARAVVSGADHFRCYARLRPKPVGEDEAVTLGVFRLPFDP